MQTLDARATRSRNALLEATTKLASETPIEEIGVDQVCQSAKISRATFYRHCLSPAALLNEHFYQQLRKARMHFFTNLASSTDLTALVEQSLRILLEVITQDLAVYRNSFKTPRSELRGLIYNFVIESLTKFFEREPYLHWVAKTPTAASATPAINTRMIRGYAGMFVGMLDAWVLDESPDDADFISGFIKVAKAHILLSQTDLES